MQISCNLINLYLINGHHTDNELSSAACNNTVLNPKMQKVTVCIRTESVFCCRVKKLLGWNRRSWVRSLQKPRSLGLERFSAFKVWYQRYNKQPRDLYPLPAQCVNEYETTLSNQTDFIKAQTSFSGWSQWNTADWRSLGHRKDPDTVTVWLFKLCIKNSVIME